MEEIKVSVIIPIYGVEDYIERCARTLFGQTMRSGIEYIFVDDCTPDRSVQILQETLKEYPERAEQVTILTHSVNKGLAATRKTGVRAARGEYIIHCDSDDWVEPEMYRLMYEEANRTHADMVVCDYINEYETGSEPVKQEFNANTTNQLIDLIEWRLHTMVWLRMFRRSFYETFGMDTPDVNRDEDFPVSFVAHALSSKVSYLPLPLYHYNRINPGSITARDSCRNFEDSVKVWSYVRDFVHTQPADKELESVLNRRISKVRNKILRYREIYDLDRWRNLWPDLKLKDCFNLRSKVWFILAKLRLEFILRIFMKGDV
ncbi:MAG: glycosyltransferase family 2 protein [Bacteroidales bacterium]|nr:glycosyltransferase family 2 protein [Bacteroidales bacterium]